MLHRRALILNGLWIAICVSGCQKGPSVDFGTVKGIVKVNGKPQRGAMVQFSPDREKGPNVPVIANGTSDDQGSYTLKYSYKGKIGDGAPVGWHRVAVIDTTVGATPQGQEPKPAAVPLVYNAPGTTPILVEVKAGENSIDLEVKK